MYIFESQLQYEMKAKTSNISISVPDDFLEVMDKFVADNKEETNRNRSNWFVYSVRKQMKIKKNK